jgi:hypothetical protein
MQTTVLLLATVVVLMLMNVSCIPFVAPNFCHAFSIRFRIDHSMNFFP